jgi:hypothetical protein
MSRSLLHAGRSRSSVGRSENGAVPSVSTIGWTLLRKITPSRREKRSPRLAERTRARRAFKIDPPATLATRREARPAGWALAEFSRLWLGLVVAGAGLDRCPRGTRCASERDWSAVGNESTHQQQETKMAQEQTKQGRSEERPSSIERDSASRALRPPLDRPVELMRRLSREMDRVFGDVFGLEFWPRRCRPGWASPRRRPGGPSSRFCTATTSS